MPTKKPTRTKKTVKKSEDAEIIDSMFDNNNSALVSIAGTLAGTFVGITGIVFVFNSGMANILPGIAWAFAVLGIALGYFATKK